MKFKELSRRRQDAILLLRGVAAYVFANARTRSISEYENSGIPRNEEAERYYLEINSIEKFVNMTKSQPTTKIEEAARSLINL